MRARLFAAFAALAFLSSSAFSQEHPNVAKGLGNATSAGATDIDSVNAFNGNLVIRLPIGQSYPVNAGFSYQLGLVYNSQVWEHFTYDGGTDAIPARASNAGLGWTLQLGRLNPPQLDLTGSLPDYDRNTYIAPDGSSHAFYPTLHEQEAAANSIEYTRDGSYLRLKTSTAQIEFPDGTIHSFSALNDGYLTRMEDRFGNSVQVFYENCTTGCVSAAPAQANRWRITDSQFRTHYIHLISTGLQHQSRLVSKVDLQAFNGNRAVYKLLYNDSTDDQSTTGSPVAITGCGVVGAGDLLIWLLTRLVLPDGSVYDMPKASYFASNIPGDNSTTPCKTGLINRLRLPTLGQIEWDYILYKFPSSSTNRNVWQRATGVGTRRLLDASSVSLSTNPWTYSAVLSGGTTAHEKLLTNSVTDPLGNRVTRYFSVCVQNCTHPSGPYEYGLPVARDSGGDGTGRFLSSRVFDAASNNLRTTYVRFEHDLPSASLSVEDRSRLNQRQASQRTVFHDDNAGTYADEDFSNFDGLGHYRQRQSGGNFPGSNVRASYVAYNNSIGTYGQVGYLPWPSTSPWVINTYLFSWDQENGQIQYRISCFDPSTGFLLRHRTLKNSGSAENANDVLRVYEQVAGNVTRESHYGGDTQNLAANACALTPPASPVYEFTHVYAGGVRSKTSVTVGGSVLDTLDLTIDASTGLPSASRDTAGKQTLFTYDTLGRVATADPSDDLFTVYNYCTATSTVPCGGSVRAQVINARRSTVNGTDVTAVRTRFDDWGRLISEEERMPPSGTYAAVTTTYNVLGWKTFVSEQGSGNGTSFLNFDAFGRPRTIRPPDGSAHDITLAYQGVRQVDRTVKVATGLGAETNAVTTEIYDRHGRLYEVGEPNGVKTRYEYDAGNRLSKVCQGATGAGTATCGQQRLFTYDHRGFLSSEQHPEKGVSGNSTVSYSNYDPLGKAGRKVEGANDLTFTFDKAGRMTQVRETGGSQRLLKTFTYATSNSGADMRKGKLTSASRYNYIGAPFNATAEIRDTYVYQGTEGRVSEHSRQLIFNGLAEERFATTYVYDGLGQVSSLGYPDCVNGDCVASDAPRNVSFTYSNGRLVGIPGVTGTAGGVSQITYHSNGLIHQVPHANGVLFTQQNDPNGMARPSLITSGAWYSGNYLYDGAGNIKGIGMDFYVYDSLSRVLQGQVGANTQSYTYDNYGNLQTITTNGSLQNTPTSSTTNRLTSGVYDAAGNLRSWNGNTYEYDAFNQLVRYTSGAEDWVYIYDADDERFWSYRTSGNGSLWTLRDLDGLVLRQYNAHLGWGNYEDYVYRDRVVLANLLSNGQQRHFDTDHLGSVRLVTDAAGNTAGFHTYYPFGKELTSLQEGDRMKFAGHERDLASLLGDGDDLDSMHARHYSMITGRFLSFDPLGGNPRVPQSWNRYSYALGNPMKYVDPYGLAPIDACQGTACTGSIGVRVYPAVGMTVYDFSDPNAIDGLVGSRLKFDYVLAHASTGGGFLDVSRAQSFYQGNFERYAVEGNLALAFVNFAVDELFVPDSQAELGVELAMAAIPGPLDNAAYAGIKGSKFFSQFARRNPFGHAVKKLGQFTEFAVNVPGSKGSYTRWVKVVNGEGRTIRLYHDTFDRTGRFLHRGVKVPGPERHVR